jgi:hypothetical protein
MRLAELRESHFEPALVRGDRSCVITAFVVRLAEHEVETADVRVIRTESFGLDPDRFGDERGRFGVLALVPKQVAMLPITCAIRVPRPEELRHDPRAVV